jgi:hypothetical protein
MLTFRNMLASGFDRCVIRFFIQPIFLPCTPHQRTGTEGGGVYTRASASARNTAHVA